MTGISKELFAAGGDGRIIILLAGLALMTWIIAEVVSIFNPKLAGMIKMSATLVGVLMVYALGKKVLGIVLAGCVLLG